MQETEFISMGHRLTLFYENGEYYVDTGHADVGPFDTRLEAESHIEQIISRHKLRAVSAL